MFYEGKLRLFQLRLLYDAITRRSMENFILVSGIADIPADSQEEFDELIYKSATILRQFKFEIDTNALPCEKRYFTERGYKADQLHKDTKVHIRSYPTAKSIFTTLDFKGYVGSNFFRYIINRICFRPAKDEILVLTAKEVITEIDQLMYNAGMEAGDVDSEIRELNRELNYRRKLVTDVLNSKMNDISHIQQNKEKMKEDLQKELVVIDQNLYASLEKFDRVVRKKLLEERAAVMEQVAEFKKSQEKNAGMLDDIRSNLESELKALVEDVKAVKPLANFEVTKVMSHIHHVKELMNFALADRETFKAMADEFNSLADLMSTVSKVFENSTYKGTNIHNTTKYLSTLKEVLSRQVDDYNKIFGSIDSNLKITATQLATQLKSIESTVVNGANAVDFSSKRISMAVQNLT